jgi:CDP-4-dehydro-6-deoxyglucose reductase
MKVTLLNGKSYECNKNISLLEGAKLAGLTLEHSCLSARCKSCLARVIEGETVQIETDLVITDGDRSKGYILTCNTMPISDIKLDIEDLGNITLYEKKIVPAKINNIDLISDDIIKLVLRLPPNANFKFNSGQYVNIIKRNLIRSYSIANCSDGNNQLEFFIKKYENGLMSEYLFENAKNNDLLRLEGPIGTFFLRDSKFENIVFLATGTGIAPIRSILQELEKSSLDYQNKNFWVITGARYKKDLFWEPDFENLNIKYIPVLSRQDNDWNGAKGYVQDIVLKQQIDLENSQVYACGSDDMIKSAKELFLKNNLKENNFFSDAFVQTN